MDYCSTVWSGVANYKLERLLILQKKSARIILDKDPREPHDMLFSQLHLLPIYSKLNFRRSMLVDKSINKLLPIYAQFVQESI